MKHETLNGTAGSGSSSIYHRVVHLQYITNAPIKLTDI